MLGKPFHIVVAEDDDDDAFIITDAIMQFNKAQIKITTVANGVQLLDFLLKRGAFEKEPQVQPDLILLDINMPMQDGLQALTEIKKEAKLRHIPVFIITTMRSMEKVEQCLELGANNFYTKPNHMDGYRKMIAEILVETLSKNLPENAEV